MKSVRITVEWDTDSEEYDESMPTEFEFTQEELGLDDEEFENDDDVRDVVEEKLWGQYCDVQDIWIYRN